MAKKFNGWTNEELLIAYAEGFYKETKKAFSFEQSILKELDERGVVDFEKMKELYDKRALGDL